MNLHCELHIHAANHSMFPVQCSIPFLRIIDFYYQKEIEILIFLVQNCLNLFNLSGHPLPPLFPVIKVVRLPELECNIAANIIPSISTTNGLLSIVGPGKWTQIPDVTVWLLSM